MLLDQKLEDVKKEEVPAQSPVEVPVIDPDSGDRKPVPQGKESKEAVEPKEAKPKAGEVDGTAKRLKVIDKPFGSKPIDDHLKEYKALIALFEKKVALVVKGEDTKAIDLEMKKRAEAFNAKGNLVREAVNKLTPKEGTRFNHLIMPKMKLSWHIPMTLEKYSFISMNPLSFVILLLAIVVLQCHIRTELILCPAQIISVWLANQESWI